MNTSTRPRSVWSSDCVRYCARPGVTATATPPSGLDAPAASTATASAVPSRRTTRRVIPFGSVIRCGPLEHESQLLKPNLVARRPQRVLRELAARLLERGVLLARHVVEPARPRPLAQAVDVVEP